MPSVFCPLTADMVYKILFPWQKQKYNFRLNFEIAYRTLSKDMEVSDFKWNFVLRSPLF